MEEAKEWRPIAKKWSEAVFFPTTDQTRKRRMHDRAPALQRRHTPTLIADAMSVESAALGHLARRLRKGFFLAFPHRVLFHKKRSQS